MKFNIITIILVRKKKKLMRRLTNHGQLRQDSSFNQAGSNHLHP